MAAMLGQQHTCVNTYTWHICRTSTRAVTARLVGLTVGLTATAFAALQVLDQLGVRHAGSGLQPAAAAPAVVTTPNGHRVAFLAYSDHYQDWEATSTTPGINFIDPARWAGKLFGQYLLQQPRPAMRDASAPTQQVGSLSDNVSATWKASEGNTVEHCAHDMLTGNSPCLLLLLLPAACCSFDPMILQQQVSAARAVGPDVLAVLIHWGPNWRWQPDSSIRALGRAFLEAGADLVFGTSPHHIQVKADWS